MILSFLFSADNEVINIIEKLKATTSSNVAVTGDNTTIVKNVIIVNGK